MPTAQDGEDKQITVDQEASLHSEMHSVLFQCITDLTAPLIVVIFGKNFSIWKGSTDAALQEGAVNVSH